MTIIPFNDLMAHAESEQYAIGYFECWSLESLMAVADAAEATQSPVLMGFSGIYLNHPDRIRNDALSVYSTMGLEVCERISIPSALVFNESPHYDWVMEAINQGFGLVMFSDDQLAFGDQIAQVRQIVEVAHRAGISVEGEAESLPGIAGNLKDLPEDVRLTSIESACEFVENTGVDAFAVNLGQMHLHGKHPVRLRLNLLAEINDALDVPLVLHGSTSVSREDLVTAIKSGIRKVNMGSVLKRTYFEAMQEEFEAIEESYNPYEIIGSGLRGDVLMVGRIALQRKVEEYMHLLGSSGKAKAF